VLCESKNIGMICHKHLIISISLCTAACRRSLVRVRASKRGHLALRTLQIQDSWHLQVGKQAAVDVFRDKLLKTSLIHSWKDRTVGDQGASGHSHTFAMLTQLLLENFKSYKVCILIRSRAVPFKTGEAPVCASTVVVHEHSCFLFTGSVRV
jgi:hypothetical protein